MGNNNETRTSYLTFQLGKEPFASHVSKIESIIKVPKLTKVPQSHSYMMGIMDLQGIALPVVDTRMKIGMKPTEMNPNTCVLVLDIKIEGELIQMGALVDSVQEVLEISYKVIRPLPGIGNKYNTEFI